MSTAAEAWELAHQVPVLDWSEFPALHPTPNSFTILAEPDGSGRGWNFSMFTHLNQHPAVIEKMRETAALRVYALAVNPDHVPDWDTTDNGTRVITLGWQPFDADIDQLLADITNGAP